MSYKPVSVDREGDRSTFIYHDVDLVEFPRRLEKFFQAEGYKLESGDIEKGVYGKGNHTLRLLFGAFVKRYTFQVKLAGSGNTCRFDFAPSMTGISGGVIGYNKMKDENLRLVDKIKRTEL